MNSISPLPPQAETEPESVDDPTFIVASRLLEVAVERARLVATAPGTVLVTGESGTGKTRICDEVHRASDRAIRAPVRAGCGELPEGILEATLFGHTRDAYTSARSDQPGLLKMADGTTLILDDIDCLSEKGQSALLRFLDDGGYYRMGDPSRQHKADVRLIATTNKDMKRLVESGRFREDLWYRLRRWRVHIPPLVERPEDVKALAAHFLASFCRKRGTSPALTLKADALDLLAMMPWPGNARTLQEAVDNIALFARPDAEGQLNVHAVADALFDPQHGPCLEALRGPDAGELEERLRRILGLVGGNISLAARIAGCSRTTVYKHSRGPRRR